MLNKNQQLRYTDEEFEIIKSFDGEGVDKLFKLRDYLLDIGEAPELSANEIRVVKKTFLPKIESEVPLMRQASLYFDVATMKEYHPEVAVRHIEALDLMTDYITEKFDILEGKQENQVFFLENLLNRDVKENDRYVNTLAYLLITNAAIDKGILELKTIAGMKDLSKETLEEMNKKNSNK